MANEGDMSTEPEVNEGILTKPLRRRNLSLQDKLQGFNIGKTIVVIDISLAEMGDADYVEICLEGEPKAKVLVRKNNLIL